MSEGGLVRRAARSLAQAKGAQGREDAQQGCDQKGFDQKGHEQKAGGQQGGCEEEGAEKEVLILRSAPVRASRRMAAGGLTVSWFETREDALLTMRVRSQAT
jgi:hypothetical protein